MGFSKTKFWLRSIVNDCVVHTGVCIAFALFSLTAFSAPVILDTQSYLPATQNESTSTWSYTAPAGVNRLLVVTSSVRVQNRVNVTEQGTRNTITSITWGVNALTQGDRRVRTFDCALLQC